MDMVDEVTYRFKAYDNLAEETRCAFVSLFSEGREAELVMNHLVGLCRWKDQTEYNDPIIESKQNSLRGVIREIKKQLNMNPIEGEEHE